MVNLRLPLRTSNPDILPFAWLLLRFDDLVCFDATPAPTPVPSAAPSDAPTPSPSQGEGHAGRHEIYVARQTQLSSID